MPKHSFSKEELEVFKNMTTEAIIANKSLEAKLLLAKLRKIPPRQQRQILKYFLDLFILKSYTFERLFYSLNRSQNRAVNWAMDLNTIRLIFLERFIDYIKELEEREEFKPQKVTTIRALNMYILGMSPESLNYLFKKGIVKFSDKFEFKASNNSIQSKDMGISRYINDINNEMLDILKNIYAINTDLLIHYQKKRFYKTYNLFQNLNNFASYFKDNPKALRQMISIADREGFDLFKAEYTLMSMTKYSFDQFNNTLFKKYPDMKLYTDSQLKLITTKLDDLYEETKTEIKKYLPKNPSIKEETLIDFNPGNWSFTL